MWQRDDLLFVRYLLTINISTTKSNIQDVSWGMELEYVWQNSKQLVSSTKSPSIWYGEWAWQCATLPTRDLARPFRAGNETIKTFRSWKGTELQWRHVKDTERVAPFVVSVTHRQNIFRSIPYRQYVFRSVTHRQNIFEVVTYR